MKFNLIIDRDRDEECLVYAKERSPLVQRIAEVVSGEENAILGYTGGSIAPISQEEIYVLAIEGGRLYAITREGKYELKRRLYEIEATLSLRFVRINQSCIVNIGYISSFDVSIGGGLMVRMKNGYTDYVSRRQLKAVKERIGIKL